MNATDGHCHIANVFTGLSGRFVAAKYEYVCRDHGIRWETHAPYSSEWCPLGRLECRISRIERQIEGHGGMNCSPEPLKREP